MGKRTEVMEFYTAQGESICFPVAIVEGENPGPMWF